MMTFNRTLSALALAISFSLAAGSYAFAANKSADPAKKPAKSARSQATSEDPGIAERIATLTATAAAGDAAKMAGMWAVDGSYVDEDGVQTRGRQALQERFEAGRGGHKAKLTLQPSTIKMIGNDAAWVEGTVSRQTQIGMEPATRFTMVFQKVDGNWLIASATETAITNQSPTDHLNVLSWLIGDWTAERPDGKVTMKAEWTGNKSFILLRYKSEPTGGAPQQDNQIIGWDPTREQIVSWTFDSTGGFGYGSWSKQGKQWLIQAEGVEQSGSRSNATNIISVEDENKFSWQSVGRTIDGAPVADMSPVVVQRASN